MSAAIDRLRPDGMAPYWLSGWQDHRRGFARTLTPVTAESQPWPVQEWRAGWDARHRLSVIEASGSGRLAL